MTTAEQTDSRGKILLDAIVEDVDRRLNPNDDDCWHCLGEGEIYDCIDGCCEDAESGCELCAYRCPECRIHEARRARLIREAVIASGDTGIATAWLKSIGRWHDSIAPEVVAEQLKLARAALSPKTEIEPGKDGGT